MPMPPAGTSAQWEYVFKFFAAVLAAAFALWSLLDAHGTPGDLLVPGLALTASGLLVWNALTWTQQWPVPVSLMIALLWRLGVLAVQRSAGQPIRTLDYGLPLALMAVIMLRIISHEYDRPAS